MEPTATLEFLSAVRDGRPADWRLVDWRALIRRGLCTMAPNLRSRAAPAKFQLTEAGRVLLEAAAAAAADAAADAAAAAAAADVSPDDAPLG